LVGDHKQAFAVIWYLQVHMPVIPDMIDKCDHCGTLFDSCSEGSYCEGKHYNMCDGCMDVCDCNTEDNE